MTQPHRSKQLLLDLLDQQRQHYERALQLMTADSQPSPQQAAAAAGLIQQGMQELQDVDARIAALRPALEQSGQLQQPDTQAALADHEQVLRSLIGQLDAAMGLAGQQQAALSQTLDGGAQRQSAQAAYRMSLKTG